MIDCPVCGASCASLPHCCGNVGPRIGDQAPRCVLRPGHGGYHRPHESWRRTIQEWEDLPTAAELAARMRYRRDLIHLVADALADGEIIGNPSDFGITADEADRLRTEVAVHIRRLAKHLDRALALD